MISTSFYLADSNCPKCSGVGVIKEVKEVKGEKKTQQRTCICVFKSQVRASMKRLGDVKIKNPGHLESASDLTYIQTEIGSLKHHLAGYLLTHYPLSFMYLTSQELFSYKFDRTGIADLIQPDMVVLDFVGVVPNKILPLFINQLIEERCVKEGSKTWLISKYSKDELLNLLGWNKEFNEESNISILRQTLSKFKVLGGSEFEDSDSKGSTVTNKQRLGIRIQA